MPHLTLKRGTLKHLDPSGRDPLPVPRSRRQHKDFFAKWNDLVASGLLDQFVLYPDFLAVPGMGVALPIGLTWLGPLDDEASS